MAPRPLPQCNAYRYRPPEISYNPVQHCQRGVPSTDNNLSQCSSKSHISPQEHFGYIKRSSECDMFELPYCSPSYRPPPVNYNTRHPHYTDSRITKDRLAHWGNELTLHDRAFGAWHHYYSYKYFYGNDRRL